MDRDILKPWLLEALKRRGGQASHLEVAKYVWANHEKELRALGNIFFTWQHELRWAADSLRREGKLLPAESSKRGIYIMTGSR